MTKVIYGTPGKPPPNGGKGTDPQVVREARKVIRRLMLAMRWDDQGGYSGRQNGKWDFISTSLAQTYPEELDALMAFAGIVPDEIKSKGDCADCEFSVDGPTGRHERGYEMPCLKCSRPYHSNFVPLKRVTRKRKAKAA
jgi:hypothetical protein